MKHDRWLPYYLIAPSLLFMGAFTPFWRSSPRPSPSLTAA
jgi:hypothetical protein